MIELKVQCDCGQRYKFDVEPVNGQMPFSVHCPICGAEGTEKANALLRQNETLLAVAAAPATGPGALRVNRSAYATPVSAPPPITPVASPAAPPAQRPFPGLAQRVATPKTPGKPPNFWMGIVGGLVGALSGAVIYFLIFSYTGFTFRLFAIPVGFFAGLGAHLLGRGEGSKELGGITAILAMAGIVAAQYFVALGWWNKALSHAGAGSGYTVMVATAKEAVKAIPTGSDSEIRNYLAGDEGVAPTAVSDDDVKNFRERNLPE
ncbi:MAG: hypothetical protein KGR98_04265, partial [Verrucomicrobia bacterium]|nr:hypothetical protein [Verrucomicrobiota bacterium]